MNPRMAPSYIALAILVGGLAFGAVGHGQDVPPVDPCACDCAAVDPTVGGVVAKLVGGVDPLVSFVGSGLVASAIILAFLVWARAAFPAKLAPSVPTDHSRWLNMTIAGVLGLLLGLATVAPAIPIPGARLVGIVLIVARMLGGFMAATAAVFGRDWYARSNGALVERKERIEEEKRRTADELKPVPRPGDPS